MHDSYSHRSSDREKTCLFQEGSSSWRRWPGVSRQKVLFIVMGIRVILRKFRKIISACGGRNQGGTAELLFRPSHQSDDAGDFLCGAMRRASHAFGIHSAFIPPRTAQHSAVKYAEMRSKKQSAASCRTEGKVIDYARRTRRDPETAP